MPPLATGTTMVCGGGGSMGSHLCNLDVIYDTSPPLIPPPDRTMASEHTRASLHVSNTCADVILLLGQACSRG